jgi:hypothetical protein
VVFVLSVVAAAPLDCKQAFKRQTPVVRQRNLFLLPSLRL